MPKIVLKPAQTAQGYNLLLASIGKLWNKGRIEAVAAINSIMVNTYWNIGREIVEFEQNGELRAKYGEALMKQLSRDLKQKYGRGFSITNLQYMRLLYMNYQKYRTLSGELNKPAHFVRTGIIRGKAPYGLSILTMIPRKLFSPLARNLTVRLGSP